MSGRYLEVTYRKGRAFAAYLYLPRVAGATSARTESVGHGLVVDLDANGSPIGLEITAPGSVSQDEINAVLVRYGQPKLSPEELAPLAAA
jgi:uncharacterized protein YuzE